MMESLRIDTELVRAAGGRIENLAEGIPKPPAVSPPLGGDALSVAIAEKIAEVVDPVIEALPVTKEELKQFAQNVVAAAGKYDDTDEQAAQKILESTGALGELPGHGGGSPAQTGPAGVVTAGSVGGAAGQGGGFEQLMAMPLQTVQQGAQMAGMAGQIPQSLAQGAQAAMEQVGQLSEVAASDAEGLETDQRLEASGEEERSEDPVEPEASEPAAEHEAQAASDAERARVQPPAAPRPAESNPAIVL